MSKIYTSCFASGQTIATGDRCYLLPVRRSHGFRPVQMTHDGESFSAYGANWTTCDPDAFWTPIGDFIEAVYDDYINIRPVHTPVNASRLKHLIRTVALEAAVTDQGENRSHDSPFDMAGFIAQHCPSIHANLEASRRRPLCMDDGSAVEFDELLKAWDYFMWGCNRHRAFIMHYRQPFQLQMAILHRAAYDGLITQMESRKNYNDEPLDRRSYFDRAVEASIVEMDEGVRLEIEAAKDGGDAKAVRWASAPHFMTRESLFRDRFKRMGALETLHYPGEAEAFRDGLLSFFEGTISQDQLYDLLRPSLDSRYVIASLAALNIHISPMRMGSRDFQNEVGNAFAAFVKATNTTVRTERKKFRIRD